MFKTFLITLFFIGFSFAQCSDEVTSPPNKNIRQLSEVEKQIVASDNSFGLKLFQKIVEVEQNKNIFISPLSVSLALGMTLNGAAGVTEEAMKTTLELQGLSMQDINESYHSLIELLIELDPKVIFEIANSIWYREEMTFEQDFIDLNNNYFNAEVRGLDFNNPSTPNIINQWVDEKTHGKINKIIEQIASDMVMYLINAIYFKGAWTFEFDKSMTMDDQFNLSDGFQVPCKMMKQSGFFRYRETSDFQIVDLPYGDGDFSMTIILPQPNANIDSLITKLNQSKWDQWITNLPSREGTLELPKFTLEYEITLNEILNALGMGIAFEPYQADFSKMYKGPERLFISEVKHKTFVNVDEEGTEAAAVTSVGIALTSVGSSFYMRVDRPFIFAIREHHSQTILFMGKVVEPKSES